MYVHIAIVQPFIPHNIAALSFAVTEIHTTVLVEV